MSFNVAMLEAMKAEGLDLDACIRVLSAGEKRVDPTAADRMAKMRAKRKPQSVTRNVTDEPPIEELHTPVSETKVSSTIWVCPANVDPGHWADLLKNRKTKRLTNTPTAYTDMLADLARLANEDWPPGRLVQHAAAKGWGAIYDPRKSLNGATNGQHHPNRPGQTAVAYAILNP